MLTPSEKIDLKAKLSKTSTVGEALKMLGDLYDLDNARLNAITKDLYIDGIIKAVNLINPKKKQV